MKVFLGLMALLAISQISLAERYNLTCFYDTFSIQRGGNANFTENDLKNSLRYCNNVIYGYVGLNPDTFELKTLHTKQQLQFEQVKKIKNQYSHVKFLLSLGGDKDLDRPDKYIKLLEASDSKQQQFRESVKKFLKKYHFDGLDLSYQFPRNKAKSKSKIKNLWNKGKKITKDFIKNKASKVFSKSKSSKKSTTTTKQQFTALVNRLKNILKPERLMLTLTVLPHVNVNDSLNIPSIMQDLDFVILSTIDYSSPYRTPKEADYLSPLAQPRHKSHNSYIQQDVNYWLSQHFPHNKLYIGVAVYARTWRMDKALKSSDMPINSSLNGPGNGGEWTHTPGLLSRPEICFKLHKMTIKHNKNYGSYAYRAADVKERTGLFLTYDDEENVAAKAEYVAQKSLAGIALFDLSLDDFHGKCNRGEFPILKSAKMYDY